MNPEALALNTILQSEAPGIFSLLSGRGRDIFFPRMGLMTQTQDAKNAVINATVGIARDEDGLPMRLSSISSKVDLPPDRVFPYSGSFGNPEIRKNWLMQIRTKNPSLGDSLVTLPLVTNALTHGLSVAGALFCDEGDEIILPDLYWENYDLVFQHAFGARMRTYPLFKMDGFNTKGFRDCLLSTGEKKIVLLNFPNNPTGYSPSVFEVNEIVQILEEASDQGKRVVVILDDAYFGLVYEQGIFQESLFGRLASLRETILAVKVDGATKEDFVWGFRIGFLSLSFKGMTQKVSAVLEEKTAGLIRGSVSNCSHLAQNLLLDAFQASQYMEEKRAKYEVLKMRYLLIKTLLDENKELKVFCEAMPFNSGYFLCLRMRDLDADRLRKQLIKEYGTGVIALGNLIRIAYSALTVKQIPLLIKNIYQACVDITNQKEKERNANEYTRY